ncbi:MAG: hypothetical protein Q4P29_02620 [Tissierellia bacterium]|nr:hypothetical protein [Tissierellia bacterium]
MKADTGGTSFFEIINLVVEDKYMPMLYTLDLTCLMDEHRLIAYLDDEFINCIPHFKEEGQIIFDTSEDFPSGYIYVSEPLEHPNFENHIYIFDPENKKFIPFD